MPMLTCKNHPRLRWSCKDIAWSDNPDGTGHYNGSRNIFFHGAADPGGGESWAPECACPPADLVLVPPKPVGYIVIVKENMHDAGAFIRAADQAYPLGGWERVWGHYYTRAEAETDLEHARAYTDGLKLPG